jgi:hypothetical protein
MASPDAHEDAETAKDLSTLTKDKPDQLSVDQFITHLTECTVAEVLTPN